MDRLTGRVGIVGAGTMGRGIAQLFAEHGHEVVLVDLTEDVLERARAEIVLNLRLAPLVRPGSAAPDPDEAAARIRFTTNLKDVRTAGFVIENVTEDWETKRGVHTELDGLCPPGVPFGVNTSAIPITRVASVTRRAPEIVGTHFMNPAHLKPTVEVIRGHHTSDATVARTRALLESAGRRCVVVRDGPGFVTNRVAMLTVNEAVFLLAEGTAGAPDIDRLFRECLGHAMGPLETADLIGLDTVLRSLEVLHGEFGDPKFRPCPLLRELVRAGRLGRKSGRGFHTYESLPGKDASDG
ncbi:3-hydroxyacyl-CoA dehydrogenase family protein [Actinomadura gamaensis]|uniref:3-hydroxyacyl-CoA dehydrogenase family protein n=1 Tax=Actinomadura gamaensis TaxID=1763541 RepID=A0ABV9TVX1_9ACTN